MNQNTATQPNTTSVKKPGPVSYVIAIILFALAAVLVVIALDQFTISKSEYNRIKDGMSYSEVVEIIGCNGEELSSYGGASIYSWNGNLFFITGANANVTFYNGRVQGKAGIGLI